MNTIFLIFCSLSLALCLFSNPNGAITAMIEGANKAISLSVTLASVYCVWLGIYGILEKSNLSQTLSNPLKRPVNKLLKNSDTTVQKLVCMNFVCNILGLGAIATPLGIEACKIMQEKNNFFGAELLVVISATSLQILPTSVISIAISAGATKAYSLILPCFLTTLFSTCCGICLFFIFKGVKGNRV